MSEKPVRERLATCRCGNVGLALSGEPIVTATCYCTSCQTAAARFESLEGARPILEPDGGTPYVLFRKDRVHLLRGGDRLREHRLKPSSSTRRVVASCCNTPILTEFQNGHWLSVYSHTLPEAERPPVEMRTMTMDRRPGVEFHDAVPSYRRHSGRFMWRLFAAWAAMGFRAPRIDWVKGKLDEKAV